MHNFGQDLAKIVLIRLFYSPTYMFPLFEAGEIDNVVFTEMSFLNICLRKKYLFVNSDFLLYW